MVEIIWTEPAEVALGSIADYIAIHDPDSARVFVRRMVERVEQLRKFPTSGSLIPEMPGYSNRQLLAKPYRIFYRTDGTRVYILNILRSKQQFHPWLLGQP